MPFKVIFMGSPEFALPSLRNLARAYPVVGVVTQPDRPSGRGHVITPPPIKDLARQLGIPVIQPNRLKDSGVFEQLQEWNPDLIVVTAFGQILRQNVLDLPRKGCINVHASLLPRWRGAAPIQAALLHGDPVTGVSIMKMDPGIDTGPILTQQETPILPEDNADTLGRRLSEIGADLLIETLPGYLRETVTPHQQDESKATYIGMIKKEDGLLDFNQSADELSNRVRAYNPWPGTYFLWNHVMVKVYRAHAVHNGECNPQKNYVINGFPAVGTSSGWLVLDDVQPAGKKVMPGDVFLRGYHHWNE